MSSNCTEEKDWFPSFTDKLVIAVIFGSIILTGVVGNVLVLALIVFVKKMRTAVNLCLAALALADLIVLVFLPTIPLVYLFDLDASMLGANFCVFVSSIDRGAVVASTLILLLVAVERYTVLCHPLKSIGMWTTPKISGLLFLIWLITVGVSIPFGYAARYEEFQYDNITQAYCYITWYEPWVQWYDHAVMITTFFLPIPVLMVLYGKMIITLKTQVPQSDAQGAGAQMARKSRLQVIVMLVSVLVIFVVCLLPLNVYIITMRVNPEILHATDEQSDFAVNWFFRLLLYVNHIANPIVYFLISENFRTSFRQLFCACCAKAKLDGRSSAIRTTASSQF